MLSIVPCEKKYYVPPHARESIQQCESRYEGISQSIAEVVYHPNSKPLWNGNHGRARTALTVLTIMYFESGFRRDIDLGIERERLSMYGWNDYGRSWCMMQIHLGKKNRVENGQVVLDSAAMTPQGWNGRQLIEDRRKCVAAGLTVIQRSFKACHRLPFNQKLRVYASGSVDKGGEASASRMKKMVKLFAEHLPNFSDGSINYNQSGLSCSEGQCVAGPIESTWFGPFGDNKYVLHSRSNTETRKLL